MRRQTITAATLVRTLAECGSGSTPASDLASDDGETHPVANYKTVLGNLAAKCKQDQKQLVSMVEKRPRVARPAPHYRVRPVGRATRRPIYPHIPGQSVPA